MYSDPGGLLACERGGDACRLLTQGYNFVCLSYLCVNSFLTDVFSILFGLQKISRYQNQVKTVRLSVLEFDDYFSNLS